jgi:hypothetical protein
MTQLPYPHRQPSWLRVVRVMFGRKLRRRKPDTPANSTVRRKEKGMTKIEHGRAVAILLAALLAAMVLARVASARTVGTESFPGSTGAIAFTSTRDDARN